MKLDQQTKRAVFDGEDGERLVVRYDNRGEPYRSGATFSFEQGDIETSVFMERRELEQLSTWLVAFLTEVKR
jgi:hypothetical protein